MKAFIRDNIKNFTYVFIISLVLWLIAFYALGFMNLITGMLCLLVLMVATFSLGLTSFSKYYKNILLEKPKAIFYLPLTLSSISFLYYIGTEGSFLNFIYQSLYFFIPTISAYIARIKSKDLNILDLVTILLLWIPVDFNLIQPTWTWPESGVGTNAYTIPTGVLLITLLFSSFRRLNGIKERVYLSIEDWGPILKNFLIFIAIAIPFGLVTGFIQFNYGKEVTLIGLIGSILATFFLIAIPEELLFRGVIQNILQKKFSSKPNAGLYLASVIFGISHLNNGPFPDWRYLILATIAGYFYGKTYNKCRSIIPAMLVHTFVDVLWIQFFR